MNEATWTLVIAAATVGALHTIAPDHWMPFVALARSREWSAARAARTTILCAFGHVTVSAALGVAALFIGLGTVKALGTHLENQAIYLLMIFGTIYMIWGLRRSFRRDPLAAIHPHDHHHSHGHHDHDHGLTEWSLFLIFSADPCVALIPMIMAAASGGWAAVGFVILAYEIATIGTMVVLVISAYAGARTLQEPAWMARWGDAVAGATIVFTGAAVALLGI